MDVFWLFSYCELFKLCINCIDIMSTLVNELTIEQVHKEFTSLVDKILAKFHQLDSGKFGAVGTCGFNTKSTELESFLEALKSTFSDLNLYAGRQCQSCGGEQLCLHT